MNEVSKDHMVPRVQTSPTCRGGRDARASRPRLRANPHPRPHGRRRLPPGPNPRAHLASSGARRGGSGTAGSSLPTSGHAGAAKDRRRSPGAPVVGGKRPGEPGRDRKYTERETAGRLGGGVRGDRQTHSRPARQPQSDRGRAHVSQIGSSQVRGAAGSLIPHYEPISEMKKMKVKDDVGYQVTELARRWLTGWVI